MNQILRKMIAGALARPALRPRLGVKRFHRLAGSALAAALAFTTLGAPAPISAAGTLTLTVTGGSTHQIGDTITLTPGGTYNASGFGCSYILHTNVGAPSGGTLSGMSTISNRVAANPDGTCPVWSFVLPRPDSMWSSGDNDVLAMLRVADGDLRSDLAHITYTPSAAQVIPASSLPAIFWTLSHTNPSPGQAFTVTPIVFGPSSPCSVVSTQTFPPGNTVWGPVSTLPAGCGTISFTQAFPATLLEVKVDSQAPAGAYSDVSHEWASSMIFVPDPPIVAPLPTPSPSPSPSPVVSPSPSPSPSASPSPSPKVSASPAPPLKVVFTTADTALKANLYGTWNFYDGRGLVTGYVGQGDYAAKASGCIGSCKMTFYAGPFAIGPTNNLGSVFMRFEAGTHTARVVVRDSAGRTAQASVLVRVIPAPTPAPMVTPSPSPSVVPVVAPAPVVTPSPSASPVVTPTPVVSPAPSPSAAPVVPAGSSFIACVSTVSYILLGWILVLLVLLGLVIALVYRRLTAAQRARRWANPLLAAGYGVVVGGALALFLAAGCLFAPLALVLGLAAGLLAAGALRALTRTGSSAAVARLGRRSEEAED